MGGAIAMDFAARYPKRVAGADSDRDRCQVLRFLRTASRACARSRWAGRRSRSSPTAIRPRLSRKISTLSAKAGASRSEPTRVFVTPTWSPARRSICAIGSRDIAAPTLILAGADDLITTPAEAELIKDRIRGSRLKLIADASHNLTTRAAGRGQRRDRQVPRGTE